MRERKGERAWGLANHHSERTVSFFPELRDQLDGVVKVI